MVGEETMENITEVNRKKERIQEFVFQIIRDTTDPVKAAEQITAVIMAKRYHIEGMDGIVALQQNWTEAQCRLLIEILA